MEDNKLMLKGVKVAVLQGGPGSERKISLASAKSVSAALAELGAEVVDVDVQGEDFEIPEGTDIAFNVIHGTFGEDGQIQKILKARGVPYTGAGEQSSRLAFDKILSKEKFIAAGVPTPSSETVRVNAEGGSTSLSLPLVVKPPREGSSVGVTIVKSPDALQAAFCESAKYDSEALVEDYIEGKELTVGVLGGEALPVIEICPRDGFYDINNKYPWLNQSGGTDYYCPADLPDEVTEAVQAASLQAYASLGIEVYARVDLLLDAENRPFVLEINTIPGMTESSLLPKAARAAGIGFPELCGRIVELSRAVRGGETGSDGGSAAEAG